MLESLDILIGFTVVMLAFSLVATAIIQFIISFIQLRGINLLLGIRTLLKQLDPKIHWSDSMWIAYGVVRHPMVARGVLRLGSVVQREELIQILLGFAAGTEPGKFNGAAKTRLVKLLKDNGIEHPDKTLDAVRSMALEFEKRDPEMAAHIRHTKAIVEEAASQFVAKIHTWFDSTMDRVSQVFTAHVRLITAAVAIAMAFAAQLDSIQLINRLSIDKDLRAKLVTSAYALDDTSRAALSKGKLSEADSEQFEVIKTLASSELITIRGLDPRNIDFSAPLPKGKTRSGIFLSAVLLGLGAPFWFGALRTLLNLRSTLADKEDKQRDGRAKQASSEKPASTASNSPPIRTEAGAEVVG